MQKSVPQKFLFFVKVNTRNKSAEKLWRNNFQIKFWNFDRIIIGWRNIFVQSSLWTGVFKAKLIKRKNVENGRIKKSHRNVWVINNKVTIVTKRLFLVTIIDFHNARSILCCFCSFWYSWEEQAYIFSGSLQVRNCFLFFILIFHPIFDLTTQIEHLLLHRGMSALYLIFLARNIANQHSMVRVDVD